LVEIGEYIAADNPPAADRVVDALMERVTFLSGNPQIGSPRADIAEGMRLFPVGNYLLLYREIPTGVEVVRILHGARDLERLL
jgi:toxin ParE1/3/4